MKDWWKLDDGYLVTRGDCREMGLNYSSTQFARWEDAGLLTPIKVGGLRSARVHYRLGEVRALLGSRVGTAA